MENKALMLNAEELRAMLEKKEPIVVLDVRPKEQREEWHIPGSRHVDAYKQLNEGDNSVLNEIDIPKNTRVVTVCAAGRTSQIASEALRIKGIDAWSLEGGMKAWSTAWNEAARQFEDFEVLQLRRTGKGCLSYILSSEKEAIIIDASLPAEVYEKFVRENQLSITYVIETHIHADHLSRSKMVAEHFHAPLFLPAPNKIQFPFQPITANTVFSVGAIKLNTVSTPGHTLESVSFSIADRVIFTGDTLFTNGVGRPDLTASEEEARKKTKLLYMSLQKLL